MQRAVTALFALLLAGAWAPVADAQEGSGPSGKLSGDGLELEWRIDGAETGPRFFADRTWQANGNVTSSKVQFTGVMRVSVPHGYATDASTSAYISLPFGAGKKEVKWGGELAGSLLSHEQTFELSIDVPPGKPVLVSASVGKTGGASDLLAVTFQFAPAPVEKTPAANASPYEPYWAWVRTEPPRIVEYAKGPTGSLATGRDGVALVKTVSPGENDEPSSRTMSAMLRWKLPLWIRAGASAPIQFSIDKVRFRRTDDDTRQSSTVLELVGIVSPPGGYLLKQHETFGRVTKALTDHSPDVLNPSPITATAPLATPAYAKELEWKPMLVGMIAGAEPAVEVIYSYVLRQVVDPQKDPPVAADPDDPTTPCAGKSAADRAAMLALGRQLYFESTYLWLDYATAMGPRKLWWNWSDFKSKYHIEAISLTGETVAKWAMTGRGAAAAVLAVGLTGNAIEDGVASGLRSLDRALLGDRVMLGLAQIYAGYAAKWDAIDKLGTAEERRAELEKLGAQLNGVDKSNALAPVVVTLAPYEYYWGRAGSDMTFHGNLMARLYDLHLAERDLGCLP